VHGCICEDFIVGLLADSVILHDTVYANIGETVVLRCPYTSHDLQSQWRGPPNLTVLSFGKEIKTSLGNYDRLELHDNHDNRELNLKVKNFTRTDEGYYRCISNVDGIAVESDLQVGIEHIVEYFIYFCCLTMRFKNIFIHAKSHIHHSYVCSDETSFSRPFSLRYLLCSDETSLTPTISFI
jgi:hypothetical protein